MTRPELLSLLGGLPVPIAVHAASGDASVCFLNPAFERAFGYTLADVPTVDAWARLAYPDPAYRQQVLTRWWDEIAARQASGEVAPPAEYRFRDRAGRVRDVLIGFALQDDLVIVTFQDLTETRAAEAALDAERRQHERTAHSLTENMPAGAYAMVRRPGAANAEFSFVSKQFLRMLGMTREEAVVDPMTCFALVHPEDRAHWKRLNAAALASELPFSGETRIVVNDQTRWVRAEAVPRRADDGSTIWEGVLVDITQLKEVQQRLATVLRASKGYTWRVDLRTRQSEFDQVWAAPAGYVADREGLTIERWYERVHPDDLEAARAAIEALEGGAADRLTFSYRRRVGEDDWIGLQVHAGVSARDPEGRPTALSGVSFDVTAEMAERSRVLNEQAQLREDLQRARQRDTVAQVAGSVAHELGNVISVIAGTVETLGAGSRDPQVDLDALGRIRRSVDMARELIVALGGLARPELPRQAHDIGKLLRDSVSLLGPRRIAHHAVRIEPGGGQSLVWANPTEVVQVIDRLALNACEAGTPERPARVTLANLPAGTAPPARPPDAGVAPAADQPVALFTVSDTGRGIPDDVRRLIFKPSMLTKGATGAGLGLPIVSTILQTNRAALWIDSAPGKGTTVTVAWPSTLPATVDVAPGSRFRWPIAPLGDAAVPPDLLRDLRILVVDDLADAAEVLAEMMEAAGAVAVALSDPVEAARALAEAPNVWSALITDLHMPGIDGRALARHARTLSPPVPSVLVTARTDMLGDLPAPEFSAVLPKPVSAYHLARAVYDAARR